MPACVWREGPGEISKVAVGLDVRSGQSFEQLSGVLDVLRAEGIDHEILFLDAKDQVLVKRYKETRRNHPLDRTGKGGRGDCPGAGKAGIS